MFRKILSFKPNGNAIGFRYQTTCCPIKVALVSDTATESPESYLRKRTEVHLTSAPFGEPSDWMLEGEINDVPCILLSRYGKEKRYPPSKINFRANMHALRELGCTHVVGATACGSLKIEIKPGDLIVLSDFIDRTSRRKQSFYDGEAGSLPGVFHLPMHPPFSEPMRQVIIATINESGLHCHETATALTVEGPRFSSKAESRMFQMLGCDVINMTTVPEVMLAKEAGLLYAEMCLSTDYDCWKEDHRQVSYEFIQQIYRENMDKVQGLLATVVKNISKMDWNEHINDFRKSLGDVSHVKCECIEVMKHDT